MKNKELTSLGALMVCGLALTVTAQAEGLGTYSVNPTDIDGNVLPGFYPNVELDAGYDDNVLRTDGNKKSSSLVLLKPEFQWVGAMGKHRVRAGYQGEYVRFFDQTDDNYFDHFLGADTTLDLTRKLNVNAALSYRRSHEDRGAAGVINQALKPNRWRQWTGKVEVLYGRRIAIGQIGLSYEHRDREFTNNNQSVRDYQADVLTLTGYYNLGSRTQLLVEPSQAKFTYPNSIDDNTVDKLMAGVTWSATAKTTGRFKIGRYDKNFDNTTLKDASGLSLDMEVVWEPKTYSQVVFKARRESNDSVVGGSSSYESSVASVEWKHDFSFPIQLQFGASYENDSYDVGREDDYFVTYIGFERPIAHNLNLVARYHYAQRDSSVAGFDYDDNQVFFGVKTKFD
jgi:polysaccharide biosynthesis protein VpsM